MIAAQPHLGALLTALGVVDSYASFDGLGLERLFVDYAGEPPSVDALRGVSSVVCWFAARDPVFVRRLREVVPSAVVASPTGDGSRLVWVHLLGALGIAPGPWCERLAVPPPLMASGRAVLGDAGWDGHAPFVMIHAGAGGLAKRWPVDGFVRSIKNVASGRRLALVILQGPADSEATAALSARLPDAAVLAGVALTDLAGALTHACAWLGNDSGASHLAAAVGIPARVLFQARSLAWRPWCASAQTITVDTSAVRDEDLASVSAGLRAVLDAAP